MKLSDVMGAMRLETYAEIALLLFLFAFLAVAYQITRRRASAEFERARHLPLDDALEATSRASREE